MAVSTIDGTVEEAVLKRRRNQGSVYDRIKFRLDDGSTKTWTKAIVMNDVAALLAPGTRGRFYTFTAIDLRGISGVRTDDGREASGIARTNEYIGLAMVVIMGLITIVSVTAFDEVRILPLVLLVLGLPMYLLSRQTRVDAEKQFAADAGYRPPPRVG